MGRKNLKGSVSIDRDKNMIRLRWRYLAKRYSLNLFSYSKANLLQAKMVALMIEHDMVTDAFDVTLNRYRKNDTSAKTKEKSIVEHFEHWANAYRNMDCDRHVHYNATRNMIRRWGAFDTSEVVPKLNSENFNERTYNLRLSMLKSFFAWLVKQKVITSNPVEDVRPKKVKRKTNPTRKPFTEGEISRILHAFKYNTCCPASSRYDHVHYYAFVYFIFSTGVRNAEAIGLRVKSIQLEKNLIEISEVLARSLKGTNAAARIRKETKNGKTGQLPLTKDLSLVLKPLIQNKKEDDLVFLSYNGLAIDDHNFQRRVFKPILKSLGIEERVLYAFRHTFSSRCMESGLTPLETAFLLGNNPETALRNYTHQINLPEKLPSIKTP